MTKEDYEDLAHHRSLGGLTTAGIQSLKKRPLERCQNCCGLYPIGTECCRQTVRLKKCGCYTIRYGTGYLAQEYAPVMCAKHK